MINCRSSIAIQPGDFAQVRLMIYAYENGGIARLEQEQAALVGNGASLTVYRGTEMEVFPARLGIGVGGCEFSLRGGNNYVPVMVEGFSGHAGPLLFEKGPSGWRPSPVMGEGMQWAQPCETDDGRSVGFAFLVPASDRSERRYFMSRVDSLGTLTSVRFEDGALVLTQGEAARLSVTAPVLFLGLDATVDRDGIAESEGRVVETRSLPVSVIPASGNAEVGIQEYTPQQVRFRMGGGGRGAFVFEGLTPGATYELGTVGGSGRSLETDDSGTVRFELDSQTEQEYVLKRTSKTEFLSR